MKTLTKIAFVTTLSVLSTVSALCTAQAAPAPAPEKAKNWTPPSTKIYAQVLSEKIMKAHPELISITFHGVPPGAAAGTYTMFAGSYLDRIGNPDDPDDIDIITKGITIVDPRWHRTNDTVKKFVMMMPMRDAAGENIGLLVAAYKNDGKYAKGEKGFFMAGTALRDSLQKQIPSFEALFNPVH
ncbi:hypothetical protein PTE30175_02346 [Pandoraea terrae]|uniref:Uncharacterized protein n=1 Tax=Pandoraea terrae TaxID=1537710 RepID=A0A5E4V342_9BURK|nr:hypothetical protein [Pandoraea terrae]VVE06648.1 hypothetical protein PTE30175_02346 [Pandoraea terrae]